MAQAPLPGRRPGTGTAPKVWTRITEADLDAIDRIAAAERIPRSVVLRRLVQEALQVA